MHDRPAGSNWVIPVPAGSHPPFSFEARKASGKKPGPFPDGAKVKVVRRERSVRLEFPLARNTEGCRTCNVGSAGDLIVFALLQSDNTSIIAVSDFFELQAVYVDLCDDDVLFFVGVEVVY